MGLWPHLRSLLLPATVTIGIPALIGLTTGLEPVSLPAWAEWLAILAGGLLVVGGVVFLAWTITLFYRIGKGTLAHWPPTQNLVVHGPYRHVRNPMMTGVFSILIGEVVAFVSVALLVYVVLYIAVVAIVIRLVEEPNLVRRFGDEYEGYRRNVRAWLPRLHGWSPPTAA